MDLTLCDNFLSISLRVHSVWMGSRLMMGLVGIEFKDTYLYYKREIVACTLEFAVLCLAYTVLSIAIRQM